MTLEWRTNNSIRYDAIKIMTYEKSSKPRMAEAVLIPPLFLLSNSKKHYLTFQYTDETGQSNYAIVHLDKKNAREAAACAEAQTGKEVDGRRKIIFIHNSAGRDSCVPPSLGFSLPRMPILLSGFSRTRLGGAKANPEEPGLPNSA